MIQYVGELFTYPAIVSVRKESKTPENVWFWFKYSYQTSSSQPCLMSSSSIQRMYAVSFALRSL